MEVTDIYMPEIIRLGWSGTDDKSEFADNTITINNSTLNGKEGENWVYSHREKEAKKYDKLTINGTVYDPASGLICYGEPDIQNKIDNAVAGETISVPRENMRVSMSLPLMSG